jgi:hypothetical protein
LGTINEVVGLRHEQASIEWWMPQYDDSGLAAWVLIANLSGVATNCQVFIAGVLQGPVTVGAGGVAAPRFVGQIGGPLRVFCDQQVIVSQRTLYHASFNETMGVPLGGMQPEWWFTWYDNVYMHTWVLIGNPSGSQAASCTVTIGGVVQGTPNVGPGQRAAELYSTPVNGPVKVACNLPVFATQRSIYGSSFNEVPGVQPQ